MGVKPKLNYKKFLLIQSLAILHVIEEYFLGFSGWATRHFGTTSQDWYVLSHVVLFIIIGIIAFYTYKGFKSGLFWALALQVIIFTNGLFHIFTTVLWKEYSPGVIAQIVVIPITYIVFRMIHQSGALSKKEILYSTITGCIISALIILSLYIDNPI
jgi:hypothetical protein